MRLVLLISSRSGDLVRVWESSQLIESSGVNLASSGVNLAICTVFDHKSPFLAQSWVTSHNSLVTWQSKPWDPIHSHSWCSMLDVYSPVVRIFPKSWAVAWGTPMDWNPSHMVISYKVVPPKTSCLLVYKPHWLVQYITHKPSIVNGVYRCF